MLLKHLQNLPKTMVSAVHKYSANEALATLILASDREINDSLILASDSESNDLFGDESSLESSGRYDSEEQP